MKLTRSDLVFLLNRKMNRTCALKCTHTNQSTANNKDIFDFLYYLKVTAKCTHLIGMREMKHLYDYSDYRLFLKEYKEETQKSTPHFSWRYLSQKAGISSNSFYSHIVNGNRNLTKKTIVKTAQALHLSLRESRYFENLVFFNQTESLEEKNHYFSEMVKLREASPIVKVAPSQYDYFSKWYHSVVRELACYLECGKNYEMIASYIVPKVSAKEVEHSVELLLKLGFLKYSNGTFVQTEPLLTSESDTAFKEQQIFKYQLEMLRLSRESLSRHSAHRRLSSATTFSISNNSYSRFVEILRETRQKLMALTETDDHPEDVFLLNMNFFPLTRHFDRSGDSDE